MPADPRLAALPRGTDNPLTQFVQDVADLRRRLDAFERAATIQAGAGAPTAAARDGTPYVDTTNSRLYIRTGGVWKFAALT